MARLVLLLLVVFILMSLGCSRSTIVEGVVAHRVLSGVKDGTSYTVLWDRFDDNGVSIIVVKDEDLEDYFPLEGDLVVSEELEGQIQILYSEVVYQVSVRESPEHTVGYLTSREIFNRMKLGATVEFQTSESSGAPEIVSLLD